MCMFRNAALRRKFAFDAFLPTAAGAKRGIPFSEGMRTIHPNAPSFEFRRKIASRDFSPERRVFPGGEDAKTAMEIQRPRVLAR